MASRFASNRLLVVAAFNNGLKSFYSTESGKNVAFLGLGNMGNHMAANLVKKGFSVRGFDLSADCIDAASSYGVTAASSIGDCVKSASFVVSCLPNNDIVKDVYLGKDGVLDNVQKGTLLIDSSTIAPTVSQEVAKSAQAKNISFIDAPMSGGVMGAKNATLAFMVGGTEEELSRARPLLEAMGAKCVLCGPVGSGEVAKLVNNLIMGANMATTAECFNLGIRMGLEPSALFTIFNGSSGRSWCSEVYCPVPGLVPTAPSSANYVGGFRTDLLVKDLGLVSDLFNSSKTPMPITSAAVQLYRLIQTQGHGVKDFSYIYQYLKKQE